MVPLDAAWADGISGQVAEPAETAVRDAREFLIVGDVDERGAGLLLNALELGLHLAPNLFVERAERLVEQQDRRCERERPGEGDTLLLAATQRHDVSAFGAGEADESEQLGHAQAHLGLRSPAHSQPVAHVLLDVHVRKHRVALENHPDVAFPWRHVGDVPAVDHDASGVRRLQPRDHPQHGRLAGAARAEKREELAGVHVEGEVAGGDGVAETLVERVEPEDGFGHRDEAGGPALAVRGSSSPAPARMRGRRGRGWPRRGVGR